LFVFAETREYAALIHKAHSKLSSHRAAVLPPRHHSICLRGLSFVCPWARRSLSFFCF